MPAASAKVLSDCYCQVLLNFSDQIWTGVSKITKPHFLNPTMRKKSTYGYTDHYSPDTFVTDKQIYFKDFEKHLLVRGVFHPSMKHT